MRGAVQKSGVEFASKKPTVEVEDLRDGEGPVARSGDTVEMTYEGTLADTGERFDGGKGFTFTIDGGEVIKGWDQGVKGEAPAVRVAAGFDKD